MQSPFGTIVSDIDLASLKRGERAAQTQVFRQFEKPVYTLAMRMLGHAQNALDALQDSFIRAFTKAQDCRGSAFGMWLRTIVVNRCLEELRSRKPDSRLDTDELDAYEFDGLQSWPADLINHSMDLEKALAKLSDRTRSVVWLYCVEGYQHDEIAVLFGQTTSFSKSQVSRGLAELRGHLRAFSDISPSQSSRAAIKVQPCPN